MIRVKRCIVAVLAMGLVPLLVRRSEAQQRNVVALSPMDYVEIQQLAARSAFLLDTGADNGYAYADLFTSDGESVNPVASGRDQLAALARGGARGPQNVEHYLMNHVIDASPEGATGRAYVIGLRFGAPDRAQNAQNGGGATASRGVAAGQGKRDEWALVGRKGGELGDFGGHYEDVYVRTAMGWRIKRRELIASKSGPVAAPSRVASKSAVGSREAKVSPTQPPPTVPGVGLTALDYVEIARLVSSYGNALDSGWGTGDNGEAYAALYAPDASFVGAVGHDQLAALAEAQPRGPRFIRHFLTNEVIEPTAEGAKGKQYLVVIDIGENGRPGSIFLGGHYEDTYVKTPDGWRFKTRRLFSARPGPAPASAVGGR